jgi:hypothetical protein
MSAPFKRVNYLSAPASAGKSETFVQSVKPALLASNIGHRPKKVLYAAPSKKLLKEMKARFEAAGITDVNIIDSDVYPEESVTKRLMEGIQRSGYENSIIFCTQAALINLPYFHNKHEWDLYIDEVPAVDFFYQHKISYAAPQLNEILRLEPFTSSLARVVARSPAALEKWILNADDTTEVLRPLLLKVKATARYDVLVDLHDFEEVIVRNSSSVDTEPRTIHFLALMKPDLFDNATVLAANFQNSMLANYLKRSGYELRDREDLHRYLRFTEHPKEMADRLIIRYLLENCHFSKSLGKKPMTDGRTIKQAMDAEVLKHLGDRPFLLSANKDDRGDLVKSKNATLLPYNVEGLNEYDKADTFVFMAAYNRSPAHQKMLEACGFSKDVVRRATVVEKAYQAGMRTSLRRPDSTDKVEFIVPDRFIANEIASIMGCKPI